MARALFIQTEWFEHLGLLSLAAAIRERGHRAELAIGRRPQPLAAIAHDLAPDAVCLTAATGGHRAVLEIARAIRPHFSGPIIMGGPHPTFFPEVIEDPALDAICRGEGDLPLPDLLDRLDRHAPYHDLPGFWVKHQGQIVKNPLANLVVDLDALPFPARDLLAQADPRYASSSMRRVIAGRGCPYRCAYCFNQPLRELLAGKGPYVRTRSVENVIAELTALRRQGARTINFVDDTFGLRSNWTRELLERYRREVGLPFIVNLRPELATEELVGALGRAGCYCAQLGVESANAELRREVLGRDQDDEVLAAAARRVKAAGIKLLTYNMVGLPGERLVDAAATLAWNAEVKADFPRVSIFQPYPRTALGDRCFAAAAGEPQAGPDRVAENYFRRSPLAGAEVRRIENLQKLYHPFIRWPRLRPLILALTLLPANPLFDLIFLLAIGLQYRKATNRGLIETVRLGLRNLAAYFS